MPTILIFSLLPNVSISAKHSSTGLLNESWEIPADAIEI